MTTPTQRKTHDEHTQPASLTGEAIALVERWLAESTTIPADTAGKRLSGVLRDPNGLAFTVGFVDGVVRPEDVTVAAVNLCNLTQITPQFLPWYLRSAITVGGALAPVMPGVVIPIARKVLRSMVSHLIVDATETKLGPAIQRLRETGHRLNINLLGEAILGQREAERRLSGTRRLLARDDVDYVSIKVSATVAPHSPWAFEQNIAHVVEQLRPLYRIAAEAPTRKFINLDMEEYKDLDITIAVFTSLLDEPEFEQLEAGIVLQAYLPDALGAMMRLQEWASTRRARGGAPVKVRVVKGANLPMESVESELHGWPLATWGTKLESDTSYKNVLNYALSPEHTDAIRVGVAGHNLFDIALTWLLAKSRGVEQAVEFEMLLGMATSQAEAVRREVGSLLLYTPVVHPAEFDVAIAYLIRRLEEGASQENFMSAVFDLSDQPELFEREKQRFLASVSQMSAHIPAPNRTQNRSVLPTKTGEPGSFQNSQDTDPSLPENRAWAEQILQRVPNSALGNDTVALSRCSDSQDIDRLFARAVAAQERWGSRSGAERAAVLRRAGYELERHRAQLIEVAAAEAGKTIEQTDTEVSEAIDFAHYYAELAAEIDTVDGAQFSPDRVTLVTPPWNFPIAIPAGSALAALAAGSAVVVKPAPPAERCGAAMVEALWAALDSCGVSRDTLQFVQVSESDLGKELVAHPSVDRVILTGAYETAELFRSFRPDLPLLAETSGKNAIIVTPSADLDLAAKDLVSSAFGHAGQKCSAASLAILVGSVSTSRRFIGQLEDAARSLNVGYPSDPTTQMGPIIEPASGKLLRGLTQLGDGERWLVQPRQLDESGQLWSPGIRSGVKPGSAFHMTEYFGPILGIITAATIEEAIAIQNQVDYGLTAGLHSLDRDEIELWLSRVQAGNLSVNRGITGAIVRRQPFGGWKKSAVGPGTKAGGPNYLVGLGNWCSARATTAADTALTDQVHDLLTAARTTLSDDDLDRLTRSFRSDAQAWGAHFGRTTDISGLHAERNILRYLPVPVRVRLSDHGTPCDLVRVLGVGILTGSDIEVSCPARATAVVDAVPISSQVTVRVESDAEWDSRIGRDVTSGERIRLIGAHPEQVADVIAHALNGRPDVAVYAGEVTESGRIEVLPFLREQAISLTAHRFGNPSRAIGEILPA